MKQRIRRIESLSEFIKMTAYDARAKIPETVIDNFVDRVVFDHGDFIWYLNPTFGNEVYSQTTSDWKKQLSTASSDTKDTSYACSSTGCYCGREIIQYLTITRVSGHGRRKLFMPRNV